LDRDEPLANFKARKNLSWRTSTTDHRALSLAFVTPPGSARTVAQGRARCGCDNKLGLDEDASPAAKRFSLRGSFPAARATDKTACTVLWNAEVYGRPSGPGTRSSSATA